MDGRVEPGHDDQARNRASLASVYTGRVSPDSAPAPLALPALIVHPRGAAWLSAEGEIEALDFAAARRRARTAPPMLCHRIAVAARLGIDPFPAYDLLELFAFVRPARFAVPTARGLAEALGFAALVDHEAEAGMLGALAGRLLAELARTDRGATEQRRSETRQIARVMARAGWPWGRHVLAALLEPADAAPEPGALAVWERLPEWNEYAPEPPPGSEPVDPAEARARLAAILGVGAEQRPSQADYASAAALAFQPREREGEPRFVLAEAGTGTGKTLGYLAPASLWAEKNQAPVWISTYTRNLQRQLDTELGRVYPEPAVKARKVVVRKGRENYFCLLNFEEAVGRARAGGVAANADAVVLGLVARWALASRDGDMVGGDLPGWFVDLLGRTRILGLADRRGECIYSACPHWRKCFIERSVRRARRADIVVANHALVMIQAALGGIDDGSPPLRTVFDEGHHLFDAADSAFAANLGGIEAAELRRWLIGAEAEGRPSRARGLKRRCEDLLGEDTSAREMLDEVVRAARALPGPEWQRRLAGGASQGAAEAFLAVLRQQVLARAPSTDGPYGLECDPRPSVPGLEESANALGVALERLARPLKGLADALAEQLDTRAAELDAATRQRIEAIVRGIANRALNPLAAWRDMLAGLARPRPTEFVDWFAIERVDGREIDCGFHRHWVDPTVPFAKMVAEPAHGVLITSATLRDGSGDVEADWRAAERRTGADHLAEGALRAAVPSPFDYPALTRVVVVRDVRKDDLDQVAAAYRELFLAAGGGGLGLFTAISRLREVQGRIAGPLDEAGIHLLAQHVDGMDTSTIVDIFRAEEDACLLGTDAVRDGVDVPGRSLRLIVFDRVPWPRPDILHKARRAAFGGRAYDDMITRLRLKQAYGRLVRRAGDKGVFVLLDPLMPSRLAGAFPEGVAIERTGLAEAVRIAREFLCEDG